MACLEAGKQDIRQQTDLVFLEAENNANTLLLEPREHQTTHAQAIPMRTLKWVMFFLDFVVYLFFVFQSVAICYILGLKSLICVLCAAFWSQNL